MRRLSPSHISHPRRGFLLSHLFTRNDENCKVPVGTGRSCRSWGPTSASTSTSLLWCLRAVPAGPPSSLDPSTALLE